LIEQISNAKLFLPLARQTREGPDWIAREECGCFHGRLMPDDSIESAPPPGNSDSRARSSTPGADAILDACDAVTVTGNGSSSGAAVLLDAPGSTASSAERPAVVIGRYKLLKELGQGGFGIVWQAGQTEPIRREVALKIIKLGMDSREIIARFEAERQALALMDHPNIASVLDAGTTDNGRPYFVMELVKGVPITEYCDTHRLGIRERLDLFIPVCQAVQHAHQKAILHRDLKPSNILVTEVDGKPVPKVIDFGIAKALHATADPALHATLARTLEGMIVGTLQYMSPEQAGSVQDVDTRSDIYTLGVILYELLVGETPLGREQVKNAALDSVLRLVREAEPLRPSSRFVPATEVGKTTANLRHTEPRKLSQALRGDLDWILLKALEKDRTRRYDTANALALDLQRHLNDEPVSAGPPSAGYRLQKLVRRNRLAFGAAAGILVMLGTGIAVSTWQAMRATKAEKLAEGRTGAGGNGAGSCSQGGEGRRV
jgi:serine/threonine protein kinase